MDINKIPLYFLWFMIYAVIGWAWESIITSIAQRRFVNRGFLNGPYCPIYGAGALLIVCTTNYCDSLIIRFIVGGLLCCILEYFASWILEVIFHARWWDYTPHRININGRVCLSGFLLFGAGAALGPYIHHYTVALTDHFSPAFINTTFSVLLVIFIADIIATNHALAKFNEILREYQKAIDRHRLSFLKFIRRGRHVFEMHIDKTHHLRNVLSFQQRRILAAFPGFNSTLYKEALARIRKLNAKSSTEDKKPKK